MTTPAKDEALRRTVRELRHTIGESQGCFAARLQVTLATVLRWETIRAPTREKLFRLATIAAPIRPDLEDKFITAIVESIEADFEVPVHAWRRLAAIAESRYPSALEPLRKQG